MATSETLNKVQQLYVAYYGRPADPDGLQYWAAIVEQNAGNVTSIISAFSNTPEATALYGASVTPVERIAVLYQNILGRDPEPDGFAYWQKQVADGLISLDNLTIAILQGAQNEDATLVSNKLAVANAFTDLVTSSGLIYDGNVATAVARTLLNQVGSSEESLSAAQGKLQAAVNTASVASTNPEAFADIIKDGIVTTPDVIREDLSADNVADAIKEATSQPTEPTTPPSTGGSGGSSGGGGTPTFTVTASSISAQDQDDNHLYSADDTINLTFSAAIDVTKISIDDLELNGKSLGTGATLTPVGGGATATVFTITLGTSPSIARGDIITIDEEFLVNASGTVATTDVSFTVPAVETTPPDAVDLGWDDDIRVYLWGSGSQAVSGDGSLITGTTAMPTATDIASIRIVLGIPYDEFPAVTPVLDTANDQLVLDTAQSLNADFNSTNVTVGTVSGVDYSYDTTTKTLAITKNDGGVFAPGYVANIVNSIKFKTAQDAVQGSRTFQISYVDLAGNEGASATVMVSVDTIAPTTTTITGAAYDVETDTLTITGTNFDEIGAGNGEIRLLPIWGKLKWIIDGSGAEITFTADDIASVKVTNDTTLSIVLTEAKAAALEGTSGFGGDDDTLDITAGFLRDVHSNPATNDEFTTGNTITVTADTTAPTVTDATAPANSTYKTDDNLDFTVTFSEAVTVTGTPQIALTIGGETKQAVYQSGSGTASLTFRYTIETGLTDANGIGVGTLDLNSGTIKDTAENDAELTFTPPTTSGVLVDSVAPTVSAVSIPNAAVKIGDEVTVTITVSDATGEALTLKSGSTIGGFALGNLQKTSDTEYTTTFTVTSGGTDVAASSDIPVSITLVDPAGNESAEFTAAISQGNDAIDANAPTLSSNTPADNAVDVTADTNITLTFSENVAKGSAGTIKLFKAGDPALEVASYDVSTDISSNVTFSGTTVTIDPSADLILGAAYYVQISAGAIVDEAGNPYAGIADATTLNFTTAHLAVDKDTSDITAAFAAYEGTEATVDAAEMSATQLAAVAAGITKVKAAGIANLTSLALNDGNIDDAVTDALLGKATNATVVATGASAAEIGHLVTHFANIAANGITGNLSIDKDSIALLAKYGGSTTSFDATGALDDNLNTLQTAIAGGKVSAVTNLASGKTLTLTAAQLTGKSIAGDGAVAVTDLHSTLNADLSNLTATTVTAAFGGNGTFTGKLGAAAVTVADGNTLTLDSATLDSATLGTASFTLTSATSVLKIAPALLASAITNAVSGAGDIVVEGTSGADTIDLSGLILSGFSGNILMTGGANDDTITANDYGGTITGGAGNDTLTGGTGVDVFVFEDSATSNGNDTISGFTVGSGGDVLNFGAMLTSGGGVYGSATPVEYSSTSAIELSNLTNQVVLVSVDDINSTTISEAELFDTGKAFAAEGTSEASIVLVVGQESGTDGVKIYHVYDGTDADDLTITQIATLTGISLENFIAGNFDFTTV